MISITKQDTDDLAALIQNVDLIEGYKIEDICTPVEFTRLLLLSKICESFKHVEIMLKAGDAR